MSAVTLETLRADFDAAIDVYGRSDFPSEFLYGLNLCVEMVRYFREHGAPLPRHSSQLVIAGDLLDVAEKHGVHAAMLYKLSDGAIDPRKGGEA
tara:strand:+ start:8769 stop:9050 length:282 start_codon:yes stop_codon:yes gene_type:complete